MAAHGPTRISPPLRTRTYRCAARAVARTVFAAVVAVGAFASCAPPVFPTREDAGPDAATGDVASDQAVDAADETAVFVDTMDRNADVPLDEPSSQDGADVASDLVDANGSDVLDVGDTADIASDAVDALDRTDATADVVPDVADVTCDANLMTDPSNCGACGTLCPSGTSCMLGICRPVCIGSTTWCGVACVDLASDPTNCGSCGTPCSSNVCAGGACCATGFMNCSGVCTDTMNDSNNCGACGNGCGSGENCINGICMMTCMMCGDGSQCCGATMCCASASIPITYSCQASCP